MGADRLPRQASDDASSSQSVASPKALSASRLAWPTCGLAIAGAGCLVVLDVLNRAAIQSFHDAQPAGIVMAVSFSVLGAIIVSRRPDNPIGWCYLAISIAMPLQALGVAYYERSVLSGGLPGARWAAWTSAWTNFLVFPTGLSLFAFLLFPSGQLPSRRWRPVAWLALGVVVVGVAVTCLDPTPISVADNLPTVPNPTGLGDLGRDLSNGPGATAVFVLGMLLIAAVIGNLVVRGRRAAQPERQQVKLLGYAASLTIACLLVLVIVYFSGYALGNSWWDIPTVLGFGVAVPVACGFAILRHGLYEIDRIISRTLVYGSLTLVLAATYIALVLGGQAVFSSFAGGSHLAVAASTLVVAALFLPVRSRAQRLVDRRFYRRRYDAQQTLALFGSRLRQQVDLETLSSELRLVVGDAMQPAHVSLWLQRADSGGK